MRLFASKTGAAIGVSLVPVLLGLVVGCTAKRESDLGKVRPAKADIRYTLTPSILHRIQIGDLKTQVGTLLGRPAEVQILEIKEEEVWSWPLMDAGESKTIMVIFDGDERVIWAQIFQH